jgi:hypothetical protein
LVRWFVGSLVRWFVGSLVRWFVGSFVRSFVCSFVRSFVNSIIPPFIHDSFILTSLPLLKHASNSDVGNQVQVVTGKTHLADGDNTTCIQVKGNCSTLGMTWVAELTEVGDYTVTSVGAAGMTCGGVWGLNYGFKLNMRETSADDYAEMKICALLEQHEPLDGLTTCVFTCSCGSLGSDGCRFLYAWYSRDPYPVCELMVTPSGQ